MCGGWCAPNSALIFGGCSPADMEREPPAPAAAVARAEAGMVPVPVAAIMDGSACCNSHWMVSPSDLWPNSLVSWKILAAHKAGILILLPLPSTLVCLSLLELLFGANWCGFLALVVLFSWLSAIQIRKSLISAGGGGGGAVGWLL